MKKGEGQGGGRTPLGYGWATEADKESFFDPGWMSFKVFYTCGINLLLLI